MRELIIPFVAARVSAVEPVDVVDVEFCRRRPLYVGLEHAAVVLDITSSDRESFAAKCRNAPADPASCCGVRLRPDSFPSGRRCHPLPRGELPRAPAMFLDEQDVALRVESLLELLVGAADVDGEDPDGILSSEFAVWAPSPLLLFLFAVLLLCTWCANFPFLRGPCRFTRRLGRAT